MAAAALRARDLVKSYGSARAARRILDGASLDVERGELVAIIGRSGSGKSTLLHLLGGLDWPESGWIEVGGERLVARGADHIRPRRRAHRQPRRRLGRARARPAARRRRCRPRRGRRHPRARGDRPRRPRARAARRPDRAVRRRTGLAALGVAAAALVVGVCVTVAYALSTGFDRAARQADLPDVIVRFDPTIDRSELDARPRAIPGLAARSYRYEATNVQLSHGTDSTERGSVHVVQGGRRGYEVVAGHDLSEARADVLVEPGLSRAWHLHPGSTLNVDGLGALRVAGEALEPDNVAYPVASAARV